MKRVIVIGAGITGLAAAHRLIRRGNDVEVVVLEREHRAGGKLQTLRVDGRLLETGAASMVEGPELSELLRDLQLPLQHTQAPEPRRWVVANGALQVVPDTAMSLLVSPLLGPVSKLRLAMEPLLSRVISSPEQDESVASFAVRRLGEQAARRLFYPQISSLYAAAPAQLSLASAFPWLHSVARSRRSIVYELRARQAAAGRGLVSFEDGMSSLTEGLATLLGGRLKLGTEVEAIDVVGNRFRVHQSGGSIEADAVIVATPAHAASVLVSRLDPDASSALRAIPYVPVTLVHAGFPPGAVPDVDGYGFFVAPGERSLLLGAVFVSRLFRGRSPDGGLLVSARIGGARSPRNAELSDDVLEAGVAEELTRLLGSTSPPNFLHVFRHRQALPQYTLGHAQRLDAIERAQARHPGLHFAGSAYRGAGVPECVRDGFRVADAVITGQARS